MTIRHHISEPLLMAYCAGDLPEAFNLVIATHISMCDECRARAGAFDALGGAVVEGCEAAAIADETMEAALARITGLPRMTEQAPIRRSTLPAPLGDYVGEDLTSVKWRPVGMGVRQAILNTGREATARLLYIPAGQAMPDHGHNGLELTLVLQGAFLDDGTRFGPGDVEIGDASLKHTPVAEEWGDCICLAASDAKLKFTGLLPRLAAPFFRI